jgi:hypothetical protein
MRLCPDVNTCYYDKEDALLLALNFKNPPGRLLRRQWSYPLRTFPDYSVWRNYVKAEDIELPENFFDIDMNKTGLIRTNQKFCFPCDNSVIRVDKNHVGSRRFGASVVVKDNMVFGVKEDQTTVDEKVTGDDELSNQEVRKASNTDCEFWLEFENKVRLHIGILDQVQAQSEIIPPIVNEVKVDEGNKVEEGGEPTEDNGADTIKTSA